MDIKVWECPRQQCKSIQIGASVETPFVLTSSYGKLANKNYSKM